jgi:hypothetical protein
MSEQQRWIFDPTLEKCKECNMNICHIYKNSKYNGITCLSCLKTINSVNNSEEQTSEIWNNLNRKDIDESFV